MSFLSYLFRTKISWKLDDACHKLLQRPFISIFFPDVCYGLSSNFEVESPLYRRFLRQIPTMTEPSIDPFVNVGKALCFPFLVWERKSDSGEILKAQNQLALPIIKALDILQGIGLEELPVTSLVTIGSKWEIWLAYLASPRVSDKKV